MSVFTKIVTGVFGKKSDRDMKILTPFIEKVNSAFSPLESLTNDELKQQPELVRTMSVQPPKINGKIRLVKISNVDLQPCGGTHVKSTGEIREIKIGKIENKGKMNRRVNLLIND